LTDNQFVRQKRIEKTEVQMKRVGLSTAPILF
jgi:hypothetical protein